MSDRVAVITELAAAPKRSMEFVAAWGNAHPDEDGHCNVFACRQLEWSRAVLGRAREALSETSEREGE